LVGNTGVATFLSVSNIVSSVKHGSTAQDGSKVLLGNAGTQVVPSANTMKHPLSLTFFIVEFSNTFYLFL
jgi:hypothetical protein